MKIFNYKSAILNSLILGLALFPAVNVHAKLIIINENDATVISNVEVNASTGGETIVNGETITTGQATAEATVYTEVNGEVVQDIRETASGDDSAAIQVESQVQVDGDSAEVKTIIDNQESITSEEKEVIFKEQAEDILEGGSQDAGQPVTGQTVQAEATTNVVPKPFHNIWNAIANFFKNIFSIFHT